ncbi:MAG TPA: TRAP transporter small permease [Synergistales bacterium]|nr:TRAP transporter small permease [Synergistales bacterium]
MDSFLHKTDIAVQRILRIVVLFFFLALAFLLAYNVLLRLTNDLSTFLTERGFSEAAGAVRGWLPITSMHWFDEIVELCFAALIFYGAASLWASGGHFSVGDWISPRLPYERLRNLYRVFVDLLGLAFLWVFFFYSLRLALRATELTTVFQIHKSALYCCMPVSSFIMLLYSLRDVWNDGKRLFSPGRGA